MGAKAAFDIFRFEEGLIVEHWDNLADLAPANGSGRTMVDGPRGSRDPAQTRRSKDLVRAFFEQAFLGEGLEATAGYFDGGALIQHNAAGADGLDALTAMMRNRRDAGKQLTDARIRHVLGEGDLVLLTAEGFVGGKPTAFYDLFRVEDGYIAEHWDVVQAIPPEREWRNPNGKFWSAPTAVPRSAPEGDHHALMFSKSKSRVRRQATDCDYRDAHRDPRHGHSRCRRSGRHA